MKLCKDPTTWAIILDQPQIRVGKGAWLMTRQTSLDTPHPSWNAKCLSLSRNQPVGCFGPYGLSLASNHPKTPTRGKVFQSPVSPWAVSVCQDKAMISLYLQKRFETHQMNNMTLRGSASFWRISTASPARSILMVSMPECFCSCDQ